MIDLKSEEEIKIMQEGGRRLKKVVGELLPTIKSRMTTLTIEEKADSLIKKFGGEASFKKVKGYCWATCLPVNEQVVHTPPSDKVLKNGDILTIDIGFYYQGFHTDYAISLVVGGSKDSRLNKFLQVGRETLAKAIKKVNENGRIGEISQLIEKEIYGHGYFIIKRLTGHGIGRQLHEDPYVLGYLDRPVSETPLIKKGLVVAIEIIYSLGSEKVIPEDDDDWSLVTKDGSLAACFEHTVAVTGKDTVILT